MALELADNPLRLVYAAIWTMLEAKTEFTGLVLTGNRIKYTNTVGNRAPDQDVATSVGPRVRVAHTGFIPHLFRVTGGSSLVIRWEIEIASGDQRFATELDVTWAIFRAMTGWATHIQTLTWKGETFARLYRPQKDDAEIMDVNVNRGIKGWSSLWTGEAELWFSTTQLASGT